MTHVVLLKLKERTPENQDALVKILKKLNVKDVPMAESFVCGKDFLQDGRSFDAALIVTLPKDQLNAYANDPYHCKIKAEMAPLLERTVTADFE